MSPIVAKYVNDGQPNKKHRLQSVLFICIAGCADQQKGSVVSHNPSEAGGWIDVRYPSSPVIKRVLISVTFVALFICYNTNMSKPRFIVLNGFAGAGKSTIARRYIADHPLAFMIEGDELIINIGHWLDHETEARSMVYDMTKALASSHLQRGYDVILPYLVVDAAHISEFEQIAEQHNAIFFNILLANDKEIAISNLMKRGSWSEAGTDPLSEKDMPVIAEIYRQMVVALTNQKNIITIQQNGKQVTDTYSAIVAEVEKSDKGI